MRNSFSNFGGCLFAMGIALAPLRAADQPIIVHEWGTFTCLQDQAGNAIGGINVDDEPVPPFVFNVAGANVINPHGLADGPPGLKDLGLPPHSADKGWLAGDPSVTMRLETPVLYIYPPKGKRASDIPPLDVHVDFHGGILSQFYPLATVTGLPMNGTMPYFIGNITGTTTTGLTWKVVKVGATGQLMETTDKEAKDAPDWMKGVPVETDDKIWTTPRETSAPLLQTQYTSTDGQGTHTAVQAEHFLFYRGVGHLDSPLRTNTSLRARADTLSAMGQESAFVGVSARNRSESISSFTEAWLVDVHSDGACAFAMRNFAEDAAKLGPPGFYPLFGFTMRADLSFNKDQYSSDNLAKLKTSMQQSLVKAGLYPDEASAMLRTWELSYFKSPGQRLFYIVPEKWVDETLPLKVTGAPSEIHRVMVGRIELISDVQQELLAKLAAGPCPDIATLKKAAQAALGKLPKDQAEAFYRGEKPLRDLGIPIPPLVQDYLDLGRFRDPLIVHEQQLHPSPALAQFIKDNHLVPNSPMTN